MSERAPRPRRHWPHLASEDHPPLVVVEAQVEAVALPVAPRALGALTSAVARVVSAGVAGGALRKGITTSPRMNAFSRAGRRTGVEKE